MNLRPAIASGLLVAAALVNVSCRTTRPAGAPVAPLTVSTPEGALVQLRARRAGFSGMRSLMRVRATTRGETRSFRAQLAVRDARRMDLVAYTPVGTTALKMTADGEQITTDPEVAPSSFDFLRAAGLTPAETAMLLLGLPPNDQVIVEASSTGLVSATAGGISVAFDPPAFPAKHVTVKRGADVIEIEHLEVVEP